IGALSQSFECPPINQPSLCRRPHSKPGPADAGSGLLQPAAAPIAAEGVQSRKPKRPLFRQTKPAVNGTRCWLMSDSCLLNPQQSGKWDDALPIHPSTRLGEGIRIYHPELVNI